jgi:hypothetical protein
MSYLERVIDKILIVDNIQDKEVSSVISILPIMVIVLFFFGIFAFVSHMVKGEKEQKVLKTIIRRDGTVENQLSVLSKEEENLSWNDLNKFSRSDLNKMRNDPNYTPWKTKSVETVADMIISQSATHTINGDNTFVNLSKNEEVIAENKVEIVQEKPKQGAIRSFRK